MRLLKVVVNELLEGVRNNTDDVDTNQVEKMITILLESKGHKVMVIGAGRSGLVGRGFAMRLMHLGFDVYFVGETVTPAMSRNDLLFVISSSGITTSVVAAAEIGKKIGARIVAITSHPSSPLGRIADIIVELRGKATAMKTDQPSHPLGARELHPPLGTMFEVTCEVFLDGVTVELMNRLGETEEKMLMRHANIE